MDPGMQAYLDEGLDVLGHVGLGLLARHSIVAVWADAEQPAPVNGEGLGARLGIVATSITRGRIRGEGSARDARL